MFNIFNKKKANKEKKVSIRIEVEDMIDQNYSCSEIAEELNANIKDVYNIKNAYQRRKARVQSANNQSDDLSELTKQLKEIQLRDKIDEAEHRAYIRQMERRELEEEDNEPLEIDTDNPDKMFGNLLNTFLLSKMAGNGSNLAPLSPQIPPTNTNTPINNNEVEQMNISDIIALAKTMPKPFVMKEILKRGIEQSKAEKIYNFVVNEL